MFTFLFGLGVVVLGGMIAITLLKTVFSIIGGILQLILNIFGLGD